MATIYPFIIPTENLPKDIAKAVSDWNTALPSEFNWKTGESSFYAEGNDLAVAKTLQEMGIIEFRVEPTDSGLAPKKIIIFLKLTGKLRQTQEGLAKDQTYIEAAMKDGRYKVIFIGGYEACRDFGRNYRGKRRLALWSIAWAEAPMGYRPMVSWNRT